MFALPAVEMCCSEGAAGVAEQDEKQLLAVRMGVQNVWEWLH